MRPYGEKRQDSKFYCCQGHAKRRARREAREFIRQESPIPGAG